jgi:PTS system N-acetylglucosamine-specific IIC component
MSRNSVTGLAVLHSHFPCSSRLRVSVASGDAIDEKELRALGVRGVVKPKAESVHLVIGPTADAVAERLRAEMASR